MSGWRFELGARPASTPEALARLHSRCFEDRGRAWSTGSFTELSASSDLYWAEALDPSGSPLAMAVARRVLDEAELMTVCRDPVYAGHSLGKRLLNMVVDRLISDGATTMFLEVGDGNATAHALYASLGFEAVGRRRRYYRRPDGGWEDALLLRTRLSTN